MIKVYGALFEKKHSTVFLTLFSASGALVQSGLFGIAGQLPFKYTQALMSGQVLYSDLFQHCTCQSFHRVYRKMGLEIKAMA